MNPSDLINWVKSNSSLLIGLIVVAVLVYLFLHFRDFAEALVASGHTFWTTVLTSLMVPGWSLALVPIVLSVGACSLLTALAIVRWQAPSVLTSIKQTGQELMGGAANVPTATPVPGGGGSVSPIPQPAIGDQQPATSEETIHIVVSGEWGRQIAREHNVPFETLNSLNPGIDWARLAPGTELKLK